MSQENPSNEKSQPNAAPKEQSTPTRIVKKVIKKVVKSVRVATESGSSTHNDDAKSGQSFGPKKSGGKKDKNSLQDKLIMGGVVSLAVLAIGAGLYVYLNKEQSLPVADAIVACSNQLRSVDFKEYLVDVSPGADEELGASDEERKAWRAKSGIQQVQLTEGAPVWDVPFYRPASAGYTVKVPLRVYMNVDDFTPYVCSYTKEPGAAGAVIVLEKVQKKG